MKQKEDNKTVDIEDVFIWCDSAWCYRYESNEMQHLSDDYKVLSFGTKEYDDFFENLMGE